MQRNEEPEDSIREARRDLEQALRILSTGGRYQPEEWLLLATLVGEADLVLRGARLEESVPLLPLFDEVMKEFRDLTKGFTRPDYLEGSRAARRRNPSLLNPG